MSNLNWFWLGFGLRNAFWNTKGNLGSEMIWLAFYSPKSHGMSRENVKIEVILTGLLSIQTPSNMKGKCLILTNFQGGFGLESTNRDFEFGTKSPQFHGHAIGILPLNANILSLKWNSKDLLNNRCSNEVLRHIKSREVVWFVYGRGCVCVCLHSKSKQNHALIT